MLEDFYIRSQWVQDAQC